MLQNHKQHDIYWTSHSFQLVTISYQNQLNEYMHKYLALSLDSPSINSV